MAAPGSYDNPSHKTCWQTCGACYRCANKGMYNKCSSCSGWHDPFGMRDANIDDFCQCTQGVLRYVNRKGQLSITRYRSNPFKGTVTQHVKTEDERDWDSYLKAYREKLQNPYVSPISIDAGGGKRAFYTDDPSQYVGFYDADGNRVDIE